MDEQQDNTQKNSYPIVVLFDEFGHPLVVKMPPQKRPIGFNGTQNKD